MQRFRFTSLSQRKLFIETVNKSVIHVLLKCCVIPRGSRKEGNDDKDDGDDSLCTLANQNVKIL